MSAPHWYVARATALRCFDQIKCPAMLSSEPLDKSEKFCGGACAKRLSISVGRLNQKRRQLAPFGEMISLMVACAHEHRLGNWG